VFVAFNLLKHGELIGVDWLVLVNAGLGVPTCEVATVAAGEGTGTESSYGDTLPIAVVDVAVDACDARMFERKSERALPGSFGNLLAESTGAHCEEK
jgi:hypothetical protein